MTTWQIATLADWDLTKTWREAIGVFSQDGAEPPKGYDSAVFDNRYRADHLARASSLVALARDGTTLGILLVARRGQTTHLSALAVIPIARRQGIARHLVSEAVAAARARGDRCVLVEVEERDTGAVDLYTRCGFHVQRRLFAYRRELADCLHFDAPPARTVDVADVAAASAACGGNALPWFLQPATLYGCVAPALGFAREDAAFCVAAARDQVLTLRAIVTVPGRRREGMARALLDSVASMHRASRIETPPVVPESCCPEFLSACGFQRCGNPQVECALNLS